MSISFGPSGPVGIGLGTSDPYRHITYEPPSHGYEAARAAANALYYGSLGAYHLGRGLYHGTRLAAKGAYFAGRLAHKAYSHTKPPPAWVHDDWTLEG
jgi:hypothetical protein